ncbi:MAG: hypothetical protein NTZ16_10465 [Verrucomicrobia bacterium]|nr:hypothetical protein [Verrucomicrobiota bacterium]
MKPKPIKLLQELRELHHAPGSFVSPTPGVLYVMRLRSQLALPRAVRRRFIIPVCFQGGDNSHAQPVKITHL